MSTAANAAFSTMATNINTVGTNKYNSGYSSGRSQGQSDVLSNPNPYGLYTQAQYAAKSVKLVNLNFPVSNGFTSKTFYVNLSPYTHVMIQSYWAGTDNPSIPVDSTIIPVDAQRRYCIAYSGDVCLHRSVIAYSDRIVFGNGHRGDNEHPTWCNPFAIYGVQNLVFTQ